LPIARASEPSPLPAARQRPVHRARRRGERHARFDTPAEAVRRAAPGSVLLVLADRYPAAPASVDTKFYDTAKAKRLRLYVEYPAMAPGVELSAPKQAVWERGIVAADGLGDRLPKLALFFRAWLPLPAGRWRATPAAGHRRVAGFDSAVYGMPKDAQPLLFDAQNGTWLIATTKLSGFVLRPVRAGGAVGGDLGTNPGATRTGFSPEDHVDAPRSARRSARTSADAELGTALFRRRGGMDRSLAAARE
jgi:hypothetical protein